jgi:molecular chaperone HscB
MDFNQDHFSLFHLPRCFGLDGNELEQRYLEMQKRVHPDRHVHLGDAEKRLAMQWSTQVNEAYQTLRRPLSRAEYMLKLAGIDVHQERTMPPEFLMRQMDWREAVEAARAAGDAATLEHLRQSIKREMIMEYDRVEAQIDIERDCAAAAGMVRQLMFEEKLLDEVDDALAVIEA